MNYNARKFGVTLKLEGKNEPWLVFEGSPAEVRDDIIATMGFEAGDFEGVALADVVKQAQKVFNGNAALTVVNTLGGSLVREESAPSTATAPAGQNAWDAVKAGKPAEDPNKYILDQIEAQTSVDDLKRLFAENSSFFSDASVLSAWKAKGKSLS